MTGKAATLIKPYLKKLVLQVHPDFFHHDAVKKATNAQSLQRLYGALNPILKPTSASPSKQDACRLEFYSKSKKHVKGDFNASLSEWLTVRSFFNLCHEIGVDILPSDKDIVESMVAQSTKTKKQKSLSEEFAEALYQQSGVPTEWTAKHILQNRLLMFDPAVDQHTVAERLSQWLPELKPHLWWNKLPVLFIASRDTLPPSPLTKGVLVFTADMQCADMAQYLKTNLSNKQQEYQQMMHNPKRRQTH
ncbi:uncharacterized protein BYT42DRAFT_578067 [Radiomyces spectabilis]|uniref:uncharacterized protein n=1 Tax=Radiomyces spectabilis TaxID=64574 RepID=UPI00221EF7EC|nr:uncharacterized protein BYT42DRAFT_578067 [Radiomyces spectabilis]KAI8372800.1 hypothetical protein BYT42DRAFT_578067 [Radiomyces spectabilis]